MDLPKTTPVGMTTTAANMVQHHMGERPTSTTNEPKTRPDQTMLSLQWWGNKGKKTIRLFVLGKTLIIFRCSYHQNSRTSYNGAKRCYLQGHWLNGLRQ
jgi:hypothetical protein